MPSSPVIDGSNHASAPNASSFSVSLTTTNADDLIVVAFVYCNSSALRTVSSVTATGLSFTRLCQQVNQSVDGGHNAANTVFEVWTAPASAALSSKSITVALSGSATNTAILAFGVHGLADINSPFDPNVSLPQSTKNTTFASTFPAVSTSTTNADDLALYIAGYTDYQQGPNGVTGYTKITEAVETVGAKWAYVVAYYKSMSGTITNSNESAAFSLATTTYGFWNVASFAVTADAAAGAGGRPRRIIIAMGG